MRVSVRVLTVLVLAACIPMSFAYDPEGFFVELEANYVQPTNIGTNAGTVWINETDDVVERAELTFDDDFVPAFRVGWSMGEGGRVSLGYWEFSDEATESRRNDSNFSLEYRPTFSDRVYTWELDDPDDYWRFDAKNEIDATSIRLDWEQDHDFANEWSLTWLVGLRHIEYEEVFSNFIDGIEDTFDRAQSRIRVQREFDGFGATVGVAGERRITDRISIVGGLDVAYVVGEQDYMSSQNFRVFDVDFPEDPFETDVEEQKGSEDASGLVTELQAGVSVQITENIDVALTFTHSSWEDFVTRYGTGQEDYYEDPSYPNRDNVSFSGLSLAARVFFGGE